MQYYASLSGGISRGLIAILITAVALSSDAIAQQKYGSISGKFVLTGAVPKPVFIVKNGQLVDGGAAPKNPAVCAAKDLPSDALVVDAKGKGIGNIFIYLRKAPKTIHPDLKDPPKTKLKFDQKNCRFFPHAMFVRTKQTVNVHSSDNCAHNTHTYPLVNEANNFILTPNPPKPVPLDYDLAEFLPMKVGCDIHPFMTAYWLILDHPYAAVTVATKSKKAGDPEIGTFKIEKLPVGNYEFRVWHEKVGYIDVGSRRGFEITVNGDMKKTFEVPVTTFDE